MSLSIWEDDDLVSALGYGGREYDVLIAEARLAACRTRQREERPAKRQPTAAELRAAWRERKAALRQRDEVRERERAYDERRRRAEGYRPWPQYVVEVEKEAADRKPQLYFPWRLRAAA